MISITTKRIAKRLEEIRQILPQILLVSLFAYSGGIKMLERGKFVITLAKSPLVPNGELITIISYVIPITELTVVGLLFFSQTKRIGLYGAFFLMSLFTTYLIAIVMGFKNAPCACGGILGGMSYPVHIAFNIFFTLVAVVGIYTSTDDTNEHSAPHTA